MSLVFLPSIKENKIDTVLYIMFYSNIYDYLYFVPLQTHRTEKEFPRNLQKYLFVKHTF